MQPTTGAPRPLTRERPPRRPAFQVLVALATLGAWWLLPSYALRLLPWPVAQATSRDYLLAGGVGLLLAALWGAIVFALTRTLFPGDPTRRRALAAAALAALLLGILAALELRSIHVGGQPIRIIASMDDTALSTEAPDAGRLAARIDRFYAAFSARDAATLLDLALVPDDGDAPGLAQFRSDLGLDREWAASPATTMDLTVQTCSCSQWTWEDGSRSTRCLLLIEGTRAEPRGTTPSTGRFLDTWEHKGGEWYHVCPGPPATTCPADPHAEGYCRHRFAIE